MADWLKPFYNCTVTVYRGNPEVIVYGPVKAYIENIDLEHQLAKFGVQPSETKNRDDATDRIYMKTKDQLGNVYQAAAEDHIKLSTTQDGLQDSEFVVKHLPSLQISPIGKISYWQLDVRDLGIKSRGDTTSNNRGVLRLGG